MFAIYALRSLLFYLGYALIMIVVPLIALPLKPLLPYERVNRIILSACHLSMWWARVTCGIRYEVIGREHIPATPCVILAKHQSAWETLFLQTLFEPTASVVKRELLRIPLFGWGLALTQPIAIDRSQRSQALKEVIRQGMDRLARGRYVLIFPEGTRTLPGEQREYSAGGAMLAVKAGVPVLPVALNSGLYWPRGTLIKRPGVILVVIGAPIATAQQSAKTVNVLARDWIEAEMVRLLPHSDLSTEASRDTSA